jgi:hypothetical protein
VFRLATDQKSIVNLHKETLIGYWVSAENSIFILKISPNLAAPLAVSGNLLPLSVKLPTQSGKEKLAHLLLHTLYSHQQR